MDILNITLYVIIISMSGELIRIILGPTSWDRLLSANLIAIKALMVLILIAHTHQLSYLYDVALLYGIIGYIGIILIANHLAEGGDHYE